MQGQVAAGDPKARSRATVDDLGKLPWKELTHAYGSAGDVPGLLRALRTAPPDLEREESPLYHLFGNIWHQGTVYEATAPAVPFLIDIAADPRTPDRAGVLSLLAEIAKSSSRSDPRNDADIPETTRREIGWARAAHVAVANGFETLSALTREGPDVALAAAHVLAQLPEHAAAAAATVRALLAAEQRSASRAGLLFLLGQTGDRSEATLAALRTAIAQEAMDQRRAAALSLARLRLQPLPAGARAAIMAAYVAPDLEANFDTLPWDAASEIAPEQLIACLDPSDREQIAAGLIAALEAGTATEHGVGALINLLFPAYQYANLTVKDLSPLQARAVRAMYQAMQGGKRIFCGHFPCWGLPDSLREWRDLAAGGEPA